MTVRRFKKNEIQRLLLEDAFAIRRLTYWTTLLFPLAVIARTLGGSTTGRDFNSAANSFTHRIFTQIMVLELGLLRKVSLPFGVALFAVARKQAAGRRRGILLIRRFSSVLTASAAQGRRAGEDR